MPTTLARSLSCVCRVRILYFSNVSCAMAEGESGTEPSKFYMVTWASELSGSFHLHCVDKSTARDCRLSLKSIVDIRKCAVVRGALGVDHALPQSFRGLYTTVRESLLQRHSTLVSLLSSLFFFRRKHRCVTRL